ncbi:TetR family transcriptional regulator [Parvibaculum sedimenti]|uniref:TetR family transcriptional regulator n=1 Tax=Parvibaculum sedimenti TaxID=2608632 RepID=A0A6N6VE28_9HYPH|nr:TetR/AcrR family transcriptional regulator [Parvibaculum sedimenti]KAB7738929.1 TetR family transcriptional regulator [Parvibaculum sedimenti]
MTQPKRQRRKEARPAEIMAAGLKLFSGRGFAATRLEDVAEAAGVSKATIYLYFDSKAELFKAIVRDIAGARIGAVEGLIDGFEGSTVELLTGLFHNIGNISGVTDIRAMIKVVLSEAGNFPDIAAFYRDEVAFRGLKNMARIIERGIKRGEFHPCDPAATAQSVIFPIIMNALAQEIFGPMPETNPERFLASHFEFVLRGLAADKGPHA